MLLAQTVLIQIAGGNGQLDSISTAVGRSKRAIVKAVQVIKRRALVDSPERGVYQATAKGLAWVSSGKVVTAGKVGPRPRTATRGLRQRAWWVIRARKIVTLPELLTSLADGTEKDAASNLSGYLGPLVKTGFLRVLPNRAPGSALTSSGHRRYQVVRDNGRLAPVVRQSERVVFDPNSGEVFSYEAQS